MDIVGIILHKDRLLYEKYQYSVTISVLAKAESQQNLFESNVMTKFVHLQIHTEYSLIDGIVRIKPLIQKAIDCGMPALAVTDHCNLFTAVKLYQAAINRGIKPIFGSDLQVRHDHGSDKTSLLTVLCANQRGYKNLTRLISTAYTDGQSSGTPVVEKAWLAENKEGLIVLSGGIHSDIGQAIVNDQAALAEAYLTDWLALFHEDYYLEVHRVGFANENTYIQAVIQLAQQFAVPIVATNKVRFLDKEDFEAHEARICIQGGYVLQDPKRPQLYTEQQYFRTEEEMCALFKDMPQVLQNSVEIAKRCNVQLTLGKSYLPDFPVPPGMTIEQYFSQQAVEGLEQRLRVLYDSNAGDFVEKRKPYDKRLQEELHVLNKMGYAGYFLIVADFIQWSNKNGVPVGPGRGSGAGSLVAYAMQITGLDPLAYELLFERFLNPERVSLPDFDIDFCMEGRDRVIEYVANKYGRDCVSQIITYGSMAAKAVVRDVGRVLSHPYGFVDKIAKLIPFAVGMTLDKALAEEELLLKRYNEEEEVKELIDLAKKLEGIVRNAGKHAGGVVIAPSKLIDFTPLYCEPDSSQIVTQFDKDDVETIGLVKFDFLGLRTLTIIDWAVKAINQRLAKEKQPLVDISLIPVDDKQTYTLLKKCTTTAVFQLESRGMKELIKRLQPDCFEEIIALVALFRPGPLQSGMVDDFIDRKHGREQITYPHAALESILCPTYGVILYQEQVMQIAQVLAGYTLGSADILRRAMGKKKPEEMAKQRIIFTQGAVERGVERNTATYIFDLMEKFAGYGFNKSHSAAYALVAYQTAWLKTHYPAEFMAAVLSSDMDNIEKIVIFVDECKQMKLTLLPPNVNQGFYKFTVNEQGEIVYGLGAIKGLGESVIKTIIDARKSQGPFQNLFDLCHRVGSKTINKRGFEALTKSGAMDCFQQTRATLEASLAKALGIADRQARDKHQGQGDLFAVMQVKTEVPKVDYTLVKEWPEQELLQGEKNTIGFYLSGHPIDQYCLELNQFVSAKIGLLSPDQGQNVIVAGLVASVRFMQTKRGDRMAFVSLDDGTGRLELAVFSDVLQQSRELLVKENIVIVEGDVAIDDYSGGFRMSCQRLLSLEQARSNYVKQIIINLHANQCQEETLQQLQTILASHLQGACPVIVKYHQSWANAQFALSNDWRVQPRDSLLHQLRDSFGTEAIVVDYY